jgi:hypothetical protein
MSRSVSLSTMMPDDLLEPVFSALSFDSDANDGVVYEWSCGSSSTTNDGQELMLLNEDVTRELTFAPSTKPGSTSMYGAASKAGSASIHDVTPSSEKCCNFEATPKAGATNRHGVKTTADKYATRRTFDNDGTHAANSTPPWDIDNAFSFCKNDEKKGETRCNQPKIQSSSGIWGLFIMNSLSRSKSGSMKDDEDDKSPEPRLAESVENDLFAMDVGLML